MYDTFSGGYHTGEGSIPFKLVNSIEVVLGGLEAGYDALNRQRFTIGSQDLQYRHSSQEIPSVVARSSLQSRWLAKQVQGPMTQVQLVRNDSLCIRDGSWVLRSRGSYDRFQQRLQQGGPPYPTRRRPRVRAVVVLGQAEFSHSTGQIIPRQGGSSSGQSLRGSNSLPTYCGHMTIRPSVLGCYDCGLLDHQSLDCPVQASIFQARVIRPCHI